MKAYRSFGVIVCICLLIASRVAQATLVFSGPGFQESGYTPVYELAIPAPANFTAGVPYVSSGGIDNSGSILPGSFSRIGYYLELQQGAGPLQYVSISMDAFTTQANKIGVPNAPSGEIYHYGTGGGTVAGWDGNAHANIFSNVGGLTTGLNINTINLEFWFWNYHPQNDYGVPGGPNDGSFDFGDAWDGGGNYGSMQIHNYGAGQTVFAMNAWNGGGVDLGIGNQIGGSNQPDWTFTGNGGSYTVKNMQILVKAAAVPEPSTILLFVLGGLGLWRSLRRRHGKTMLGLVSTGLLAVVTLPDAGATALLTNVPEANGYTLAYEFAVPVNSGGWNSTAVPYTINNTGSISNGSFQRVAYYLELQPAVGAAQWVYISMKPFTTDATKLGVPNTTSGEYYHYGAGGNMPAGWDGNANANIFASAGSGITTGFNINTVNLEFWPSDYNQSNQYGVPGANGGTFDFGDGGSGTGAGHGSMQIHNYGAAQTLFAYNAWGAIRTSELGIGNQIGGTGNPDWTFQTGNIGNFTTRTLQILVLSNAVPEPSTVLLLAFGGLGIFGWVKRNRRG